MAYFFKVAFADSGDKTAIPQATQPSGEVSYTEGFGIDYQLEQGVDPDAKDIPRDQFNQLMYAITGALQQYQTLGFPDFITTSDNGGSPYSYSINATCRFNNGHAGSGYKNYYSLVDANTSDPTDATKWGLVQYAVNELTGVVKEYYGSSLPSGYVWANGTTIGSASSGATGRANADTSDLFTLLWNSTSNANLPIQDSSGVATTRGASAAADFSANKRLPVPDKRGRVAAGKDDMGGVTAASRITTAGSGIDGAALGAAGGAQNVTLDTTMIPAHTHTGTTASSGDHFHALPMSPNDTGFGDAVGSDGPETGSSPVINSKNAGTHTHTFTTASTGGGLAHGNVQPTIISNFIIKL